jgi:hypothetical protein
MRTLYQSECCFYMIKALQRFFFFFQWKKTIWADSIKWKCENESVCGFQFELQSSNAKKVGVEELWSLSLKQKPIWLVGKNAQRGEWGRESLVMSICKCLDLVSNQRGWPKVITWYWLWVGHLFFLQWPPFFRNGILGGLLCFQHDNLFNLMFVPLLSDSGFGREPSQRKSLWFWFGLIFRILMDSYYKVLCPIFQDPKLWVIANMSVRNTSQLLQNNPYIILMFL